MKLIRVLGKRGRTTIPYDIRKRVGFRYNDVLSFTEGEDGQSVIIRREKICDGCRDLQQPEMPEVSLEEFLTDLSAEQKMAAFIFLAKNVMTAQGGGLRGRT